MEMVSAQNLEGEGLLKAHNTAGGVVTAAKSREITSDAEGSGVLHYSRRLNVLEKQCLDPK